MSCDLWMNCDHDFEKHGIEQHHESYWRLEILLVERQEVERPLVT